MVNDSERKIDELSSNFSITQHPADRLASYLSAVSSTHEFNRPIQSVGNVPRLFLPYDVHLSQSNGLVQDREKGSMSELSTTSKCYEMESPLIDVWSRH